MPINSLDKNVVTVASTASTATPATTSAPPNVAQDTGEDGGWLRRLGGEIKEAKDGFANAAGAAVGYAELAGLKYPVKQYSFQMSPGLNVARIGIIDNTPPSEAQVKQFLDFVTKPANQPAYVHCEAGVGRTGVMSAAYRMAVQGWPPEKALEEAKKFGCAMPDQQQFILLLGKDLAAGKIAGYPLKP